MNPNSLTLLLIATTVTFAYLWGRESRRADRTERRLAAANRIIAAKRAEIAAVQAQLFDADEELAIHLELAMMRHPSWDNAPVAPVSHLSAVKA